MRVVLVSGDSMLLGRKCKKCSLAAKVGEVVLHLEVPTAAFDQRHLVIHGDCLQAVLDSGPPATSVRSVQKKVDRLAAEILSGGSLRPRQVARR